MLISVNNEKEKFSSYSHLFALFLALAGSISLIILAEDLSLLIVIIIYSICLCYMFLASTLYHASKKTENDDTFWRKFDHISIYFMIAGSYTAISYIYLDGILRWIIISLQWLFAIAGMIFKIFKLDIPNWIDVGIYLIMGWMIVVRMDYIFSQSPLRIFLLVLFGGIAYTIGAILHVIDKPLPFPKKFEFHEIFHVLIIVGASLHYVTVLLAVL